MNQMNHIKAEYALNPDTGYYEKIPRLVDVKRLPLELRVEVTRAEQIKCNAELILVSRKVKGKYQFRTGMQTVEENRFYIGNDYNYFKGKKFVKLLIIGFSNSLKNMTIYYFDKQILNSNKRIEFVNGFTSQL